MIGVCLVWLVVRELLRMEEPYVGSYSLPVVFERAACVRVSVLVMCPARADDRET